MLPKLVSAFPKLVSEDSQTCFGASQTCFGIFPNLFQNTQTISNYNSEHILNFFIYQNMFPTFISYLKKDSVLFEIYVCHAAKLRFQTFNVSHDKQLCRQYREVSFNRDTATKTQTLNFRFQMGPWVGHPAGDQTKTTNLVENKSHLGPLPCPDLRGFCIEALTVS
jgi:hypothetical protein